MCFIKRHDKPDCYKKLKLFEKRGYIEKKIVCTTCLRYRLNSAGFLAWRDMVRMFNIRKFFTHNCFNNLFGA